MRASKNYENSRVIPMFSLCYINENEKDRYSELHFSLTIENHREKESQHNA